jgi:hypothetical protein
MKFIMNPAGIKQGPRGPVVIVEKIIFAIAI